MNVEAVARPSSLRAIPWSVWALLALALGCAASATVPVFSPLGAIIAAGPVLFAAAVVYASSRVGEIVKDPATLSKPLAESSGGSSVATSTSRSSRSRMTFAYSVRFNRWSTMAPGLTRVAALRSMAVSSQSLSAS